MSEQYRFTKLSNVPSVETAPDNSTLIMNDNGKIKQVPASAVGSSARKIVRAEVTCTVDHVVCEAAPEYEEYIAEEVSDLLQYFKWYQVDSEDDPAGLANVVMDDTVTISAEGESMEMAVNAETENNQMVMLSLQIDEDYPAIPMIFIAKQNDVQDTLIVDFDVAEEITAQIYINISAPKQDMYLVASEAVRGIESATVEHDDYSYTGTSDGNPIKELIPLDPDLISGLPLKISSSTLYSALENNRIAQQTITNGIPLSSITRCTELEIDNGHGNSIRGKRSCESYDDDYNAYVWRFELYDNYLQKIKFGRAIANYDDNESTVLTSITYIPDLPIIEIRDAQIMESTPAQVTIRLDSVTARALKRCDRYEIHVASVHKQNLQDAYFIKRDGYWNGGGGITYNWFGEREDSGYTMEFRAHTFGSDPDNYLIISINKVSPPVFVRIKGYFDNFAASTVTLTLSNSATIQDILDVAEKGFIPIVGDDDGYISASIMGTYTTGVIHLYGTGFRVGPHPGVTVVDTEIALTATSIPVTVAPIQLPTT